MDAYTEAFIRLIKQSKYAWRLPWAVKCRIGTWLGRRGSFLLPQRDQIIASMQSSLQIGQLEAEHYFRLLCESTGVAIQMVSELPSISPAWLQRNIHTDDPVLWDEIACQGGVILSHHSYHHNLMISHFKLFGLPVYTVANPPEAFSPDDYLYHFTVGLNQVTESNANGGGFLYINQGEAFFQKVRKAIEPGNLLVMLCDFNRVRPENPILPFLGKTLQIPNGVLSILEKEQVPVYFAGFCPQLPGQYLMTLERLETRAVNPEAPILAEQYLAALERYIRRYPAAWQCWNII